MAKIPEGSQVLVLPINKCVFSAGYKNELYLKQQGYNHYGVDLFSDNSDLTVYACGNGEVVACGTPEEVCKNDRSYTGKFLKKYLK